MPFDWREQLARWRLIPTGVAQRRAAIEWDASEARVVVATCGGGKVHVEQTFSLAWSRANAEPADEETMGQQLAAALGERGIKRLDALLTVTRGSIELKQLALPPAPDEELPALVRFQALRDFHALADDWPLDFLPLSASPDEPRSVLAAALNPESLWQLVSVSRAGGLTARHVVLRPCALTEAFLSTDFAGTERVRLLIDLLDDEAELTALVGSDVVFMRTVRLSGDVLHSPAETRPLLGELRRTLAAIHNQLGGMSVEVVYLCGFSAEHRALAERLDAELPQPVRTFDAWQAVDAPLGPTAASERYSALLGLLQIEARAAQHGLDFLNPRRAPEPPSRRKQYALATAAAVLLILAVAGTIRSRLNRLDNEIADLQLAHRKLDEFLKGAAPIERSAQALELWNRSDVVWLDELRWLSEHFPSAQDALLTKLRMGPPGGQQAAGGVMELEGAVRAASVIDGLEDELRDERHNVEGHGRQQDRDRKNYTWLFKSSVLVPPVADRDP
jgi:hypothetical protein